METNETELESRLVVKATRNRVFTPSRGTPRGTQIDDITPAHYRELVREISAKYGVEPRLVASMVTVESNWNQTLVGAHQDTGLMQIIPETAVWIAQQLGLATYDVLDPRTNMDMGTWYLHALLREYGNWPTALAVYNGGPLAAPQGTSSRYAQRVLEVYGREITLANSDEG